MILIVDDKKENLRSLQSLLALHNYPVHTAASGEEALKNVLKHQYALIILDVQMPGMDGFEVAETIAGYSKTEEIPIIFLSAVSTDKKFITKGYSSGAIDYITKPIDPDILLLKVKTLYKLYEQKRALNEMQVTLRNEIEYRRKAQQDSQEKTRELISILESIPQIAFTTTSDGVVEFSNSEWKKIAGENDFPETHPDDPSIQSLFREMLEEKKSIVRELRIRKEGHRDYRHFLLRAVPIMEKEQITKWVGTFTDIDDQKQASARKDEFISIASHELKTPLTSMKGYIQLLQRMMDAKSPTAVFVVDRTLAQIHKLDSLIGDLLDISKIESGKLRLEMKPFDLGALVTSSVEMMKQTYPDVSFELVGAAPVTVNGDESRIEQVLLNFLSNAVKYSPNEKRVIITQTFRENNRVEIAVRDFGIGISKEDQQFVFEKFYRTDESSSGFNGLGLGLYISADILQRHDAEYGVESAAGEGATFSFTLPYLKKEEL